MQKEAVRLLVAGQHMHHSMRMGRQLHMEEQLGIMAGRAAGGHQEELREPGERRPLSMVLRQEIGALVLRIQRRLRLRALGAAEQLAVLAHPHGGTPGNSAAYAMYRPSVSLLLYVRVEYFDGHLARVLGGRDAPRVVTVVTSLHILSRFNTFVHQLTHNFTT